ncbi:MAG: hypothetical protein DRP18_01440 [Candidatus Aenigmatarchaeota archaeon]|nr:MAG: hypothetical protein DRP18_01440 [Candidatus Aenigmarchaeota archaeon]
MMMNNGRKELRVFINGQQVTRWIFLEKLQLCFKLVPNDGGWKDVEYSKGLEICKRIISRATNSNDIKVSGTLVEELQRESMISKLFSEGKVVIGGVQ